MDALKVVSFLKRRADFSLAEFSQYWRSTHKAHALTLVEAGFFSGYIQNHALEPALEGLEVMADGSPELWIDEVEALLRLVESREYKEGAGPGGLPALLAGRRRPAADARRPAPAPDPSGCGSRPR